MRTNGSVFARASDELSMPVAILSLLPRTAASFLSGARAERATFFYIGLVAAQSAPNPITPLPKPSRGGDRQQGDVLVTQPISVLTRPWSTTMETGGVMDWWTKLDEEESCIYSRRMAKSPATC
jgi:hypothetical protein